MSRLLSHLSPSHVRLLVLATSVVLLTSALPGVGRAQEGADARNFEREWQVLQYRDQAGSLQDVPPGIGVTMLPYRGTVKGDGACGTFEASYTLAEQTVIIDPPQVDTRGCDDAAQAIDDAFYQGLADTRKWSTRGSGSILILQDEIDAPIMRLTRAKLPSDPTLARWDLARLGAADGSIEPVLPGTEPWIEFLRGGRVVGSTGCGSFVGSWTSNDTTIALRDVDARLADCDEASRDQAERILATFAEVTDFAVRPAGLVLEDAAGLTRLALVPAIDLGRRTWTPTEILGEDGEPLLGAERLVTSAVRFSGSKADGRSICRGFEADSVRAGLALSVFLGPGQTAFPSGAVCPKPRPDEDKVPDQAVEDAYLGALQRAASHALRGDDLELLDVEGDPVMRLVPQAELVGPTWVLTQLDVAPTARKEKLRAPSGSEPLTAIFDDAELGGFVIGQTGVTDYFGNYATPGAGQISVSSVEVFGGCSRRALSKPPCQQQELFLELLQSADSFIVEPEQLRLYKGTRRVLIFVPSQAIPDAAETPTTEPGAEG